VPDNPRLHVVTNAPEIALHLSTNGSVAVDLLGGRMRSESLSTSCLSDAAMDMLYWDVTFVGLTAVDLVRGISTIDQDGALCLKKIMEHGSKTVALCNSSKLGRFSYARIGAIDLIDVLITDSLVSPEVLEGFAAHGVEIVVAGPLENGNGAESPGGNGHHPG
jgi:DeoR family fructose operon transcriptional repressor